MKKLLLALLTLPLVAAAAAQLSGHGYLITAVARTYLQGNVTASIDDHTAFDTRAVAAGAAQPWPLAARYPVPLDAAFAQDLEANDAIAFLVAHQGELASETYFGNYGPDSKTNSFSMAKTVVTLLLGMAIEQGIIDGLSQPLVEWLPEFNDQPFAQSATIGSLSSMTSGYEWDEHYYSPLSPTVKLLYGSDVEQFVLDGEFTREPDSYFYYSSASTQLLAVALTRALRQSAKAESLSAYLSTQLWQPLGMNADALWHLDNSGLELAYCCLNSNVRNFARIGQLMLQEGEWRGQQLVPKSFVNGMVTPGIVSYYGNSTWLRHDGSPDYYFLSGHLGQYVIVVPDHDLVIVRLGRSMPHIRPVEKLNDYVEYALALIDQDVGG